MTRCLCRMNRWIQDHPQEAEDIDWMRKMPLPGEWQEESSMTQTLGKTSNEQKVLDKIKLLLLKIDIFYD